MATSHRIALTTLVGGLLLAAAAPAFACVSDGHGVVEEEEKEKECKQTIASPIQAREAAQSERKEATVMQVVGEDGNVRRVYVDANGNVWAVEDDA